MTREEAIMIMRNERPHCGEKMTFTEEEKCDAYDMAIEALSKVDTTENPKCLMSHEEAWAEIESDLISRADAIGAIIAQRAKAELSEYNFALGLAEDAIRHLPSAELANLKQEFESAEAVRGEWIQYSWNQPKENQEVYVTVYFTEGDTGRAYGYIDGFGKWHLYSAVEGVLNSGYKVTAWMPLPTPYKGGEDE